MPGFVKTKEDERLWAKAKEIAKEHGHKEDWPYITGIFKKMKGGKVAEMKPDYKFKTALDVMALRVAARHLAALRRSSASSQPG